MSFNYQEIDTKTITDKVILGIIKEIETYVYVTLNAGDINDIAKNIGSKSKSRSGKEQDIIIHKINGRVNAYLQSENKDEWVKKYKST